ncbi:methionyl-tRNA formyltransferase [Eggerthellaceae bacterium zg-1084]|uniref:methionyl-tRNA formyltransferase n=1 Tax=Berryella wangjianweii TaxID=2734634 RepID=UPI0015561535|nr:methionyl-tRNA formyltransferase [Berryella wangjianweii]NPD30342.1 methionyl-tRNA formyltransferase [Berryella wangjianweii]
MRIVFMGTPPFAAAILQTLVGRHEVAAVFTRPDAVRGRGSALAPSAVKEAALEHGIPVLQPRTLRDGEALSALRDLAPEAICVAAYGMILPADVLELPAQGCLNVHASLLPRWRGAAPIERAILAGDDELGVCIMRMDTGLDTGPFCLESRVPALGRTAEQLAGLLAAEGAGLLLSALDALAKGDLSWRAQDESLVTYADKLVKGELDVAADDGAERFARKVRASSAGHPARLVIEGRQVTVEDAVVADEAACALVEDLVPGQARFAAKRLVLRCAQGAVEVRGLRPQGRSSMDARAFCAGIQQVKGRVLSWQSIR